MATKVPSARKTASYQVMISLKKHLARPVVVNVLRCNFYR